MLPSRESTQAPARKRAVPSKERGLLLVFLAAAIAFPLGLYALAPSEQFLAAWVSVCLATAFTCVAIAAEARPENGGVLSATTFLWLGFAYFVGASAAINASLGALDAYPARLLWKAAIGVALGGASLLAGASVARRLKIGARLPALPGDLPKRYAYLALGGLLALATCVRYVIYPGQFWLGGSFDVLPSAYGNYIQDLRHAHTVAGVLAFHILVSYPTSRREKAMLGAALALAAVYSFFQFSRRPFVLLVVALCVYAFYGIRARRSLSGSRTLVLAAGLGVLLFTVALLAAGIRYFTFQLGLQQVSISDLVIVLSQLGVLTVSQDSFAVYLSCLRWYDSSESWLLGESFLQAFGNFIPRALWLDKPESFGFTIAELMGNYSTNFGPTFLGEGFANGGFVGIVVLGLLFGAGACALDNYRRAYATNRLVLAFFALLAFEAFPQVRGDLQGMTTPMLERAVLFLLPVLAFTLWRRIAPLRPVAAA
jgi:oligosaccharide repeat unit polymerase